MKRPEIWKSWERHEPEHLSYQDPFKLTGWDIAFYLFVVGIGLAAFVGFIWMLVSTLANGGR